MQLNLAGQPIDQQAIDVIRENVKPAGCEVAYSGGKDSTTLLDLVKRSGVNFTARYMFCVLDPPELKKHIHEMKADPANRITIVMPKQSLIEVARERGVMPIRNLRWCCEVIKEQPSTDGRDILTGIRWAESNRRKKRRMVEGCSRVHAFFLHPIISWKTADVWDYIRERQLPHCCLYDEGYKRLGCVLCPMARDTKRQMDRWPGIVRIWKRINQICWETRIARGTLSFPTADAQWAWWLDRDAKATTDDDCPLFDGVLE